ncbi:MAG: hypothetical protein CUN56_09465 [Phototrophicales bacterium]|nr:MAG: hypothetical protein CUN56_09465 [Phototrophicales bacterium]RMG74210.1 MAG: histidine phosphatase family protein [Chloroflexota bacterium]
MIYIIRHGQSIVNLDHQILGRKLDGDLTTLGHNQAYQAGRWLKDKNIKQIRTSPFKRTSQTAQIIGNVLKLNPIPDHDLRSLDCGNLETNQNLDEWYTIIHRWRRGEWNLAFPNGETLRQAYDRFLRALSAVQYDAVVVSHGNIIESVLPLLCVNAAALQRVKKPAHTGFVILEPYDTNRFICVAWNMLEHLK